LQVNDRLVAGEPEKKRGEKTFAVRQAKGHERGDAAVYLIWGDKDSIQPVDVEPAEDTRNRHEPEQRRDDEKEEIVPRIHRGEADEECYGNVEGAGLGYGQASGTGMLPRMADRSSSLLMLSCSARQIRRWEQTATATSFTSSGTTYSRPSR